MGTVPYSYHKSREREREEVISKTRHSCYTEHTSNTYMYMYRISALVSGLSHHYKELRQGGVRLREKGTAISRPINITPDTCTCDCHGNFIDIILKRSNV